MAHGKNGHSFDNRCDAQIVVIIMEKLMISLNVNEFACDLRIYVANIKYFIIVEVYIF